MRRAARRDSNEEPLVAALAARGITVHRLSGTPGLPDLLVPFRGRIWLFEVKRPNGKLTAAQQSMRVTVPFTVVETAEDVLLALGAIGKQTGCPLCRGLGWVKVG